MVSIPPGGNAAGSTSGIAASFGPVIPSLQTENRGSDTGSDDGYPLQANDDLQTLAATLELITQINQSGSLKSAGMVAAEALRQWLGADQVEIAWQAKPRAAVSLIASSGLSSGVEQEIEASRLAAAEEILTRGGLTDSNAVAARDRVALMAVHQYSRSRHLNRILGASLTSDSLTGLIESQAKQTEMPGGAIIASFSRLIPEGDAARALSKLEICRTPIAQSLSLVASKQPGVLATLLSWPSQRLQGSKRNWLLAGTLILAGVFAIPMPYKASAVCKLQPIHRRFVASPVNGTLQKAFVLPGDHVGQHDLIATIDPRDLELELQGKTSELRRAEQERKGFVAMHKIAESNLLELRVQRLASEVSLLQSRRDKLQIKAPIEGTIVTGDWKRAEGTVLEKGESLFEIAPLGDFHIEIEIDESDLLSVRVGMPLHIRLDAMPSRTFTANIDSIHPRAELRDNRSVFIAKARLHDSDRVLRPGMKGNGRIVADSHPLAWNLFHKAYHRLIAYLGV